MPSGWCCSDVFLVTIFAQQLVPQDPILSEYTDYPQSFFTPHHLCSSSNAIWGGVSLARLALFLQPC
jgi:hypothetical protein